MVNNSATQKTKAQQYYLDNRATIRKWQAEYYQRNRLKLLALRRRHYQENRLSMRLANNEAQHKYMIKIKKEVLTYYGNGKLACVKCGFTDVRALSIDHINGGAEKERKAGKFRAGYQFYALLKRLGFPLGCQTLCMNCQWIKRYENNETKGCGKRAVRQTTYGNH